MKSFENISTNEASERKAEKFKNINQVNSDIEEYKGEQGELSTKEELEVNNLFHKLERENRENLDKKEIEKFFNEETLSNLSLDSYMKLWEASDIPDFTSHVTRQGFRDHTGFDAHTAGLGKYSNGFKEIIKSGGNLKSLLSDYSEETVKKFVKYTEQNHVKNKELLDSKQIINSILGFGIEPGSLLDYKSLHFATGEIADDYYGAENNNEVFFIYPSAFIASQFIQSKGKFAAKGSGAHNDLWLYPKNKEKMEVSLDAGIVFLPKDVLVDSETGSIYESAENEKGEKEIKVNEKAFEKTKNIIKNNIKEFLINDTVEFAKIFNNKELKNSEKLKNIRHEYIINKEKIHYSLNEDLYIFFNKLNNSKNLEHEILNISSTLMYDVESLIMSNRDKELEEIQGLVNDYIDNLENTSLEILLFQRVNQSESTNVIPAKEYWKKYLDNLGEDKPKHIVFYNGEPNKAVEKFLQSYGIDSSDTKWLENDNLNFPENDFEYFDNIKDKDEMEILDLLDKKHDKMDNEAFGTEDNPGPLRKNIEKYVKKYNENLKK